MMWGLIVGTCGFVIQADKDQDEQARRTAVCIVRTALNDLYDFVEESRAAAGRTDNEDIEGARARLDRAVPDEDC
jgi:hypothetical protein